MANVLNTHPNCKAYWNLDPGALTIDSAAGGNTLTANNNPDTDAVDFKLGTGCLVPASSKYMSIADANLCSGFPLKSGETNTYFTIGLWVKPTTNGNSTAFAKWMNSNGKRGICINVENNLLKVYHGYGNSVYTWTTGSAVPINQWSFIIVRASLAASSTQYLSALVYNPVTGAIPEYNANCGSYYAATAQDAPVSIGAQGDGSSPFQGKIDGVVLFNTSIALRELVAIAKDLYSYPFPGNDFSNDDSCKAWYPFDSPPDIFADAKSTNRLGYSYGSPSVSGFPNMQQGVTCAYTYVSSGGHFQLANNSLAAGFPLKYGDPVMKCTMTLWMRQNNALYAGGQIGVWQGTGWNYGAALALDSSNPQKILVKWGYGAGCESIDTGITIPQYHTVFACLEVDGINKTIYVRIFDQHTGVISEYSGNAVHTMALNANGALNIGVQGSYDEATFWNRLLTPEEIDAIRDGTFGLVTADPPDNTVTELTCQDLTPPPAATFVELACQDIPRQPGNTVTELACKDIPADKMGSCRIELLMQSVLLAVPHACEIELACQDINIYNSGFFLTL
jgi:hypothetical protein